jgi:hypothetical protein
MRIVLFVYAVGAIPLQNSHLFMQRHLPAARWAPRCADVLMTGLTNAERIVRLEATLKELEAVGCSQEALAPLKKQLIEIRLSCIAADVSKLKEEMGAAAAPPAVDDNACPIAEDGVVIIDGNNFRVMPIEVREAGSISQPLGAPPPASASFDSASPSPPAPTDPFKLFLDTVFGPPKTSAQRATEAAQGADARKSAAARLEAQKAAELSAFLEQSVLERATAQEEACSRLQTSLTERLQPMLRGVVTSNLVVTR